MYVNKTLQNKNHKEETNMGLFTYTPGQDSNSSYLRESFEEGLAKPYRHIEGGDKEALSDACQAVGVFASSESNWYERNTVIIHAGSSVASMQKGKLRDTITSILERCCELEAGETIQLTAEEKQFIKNGIEGKFFKTVSRKPFYE